MIRLEPTKKSKYKVYIGWASAYYCDTIQETNELQHNFSNIKIEKYNKED